MARPSIRQLDTTSPQKIEEIIADLQLQKTGAVFYFVIDPFDLVDFSFPFNANDPGNIDARKIADDQTALYEVFQTHDPWPVLFPEYGEEIEAYVSYLKNVVDRAYKKIDFVAELISRSELDATSSPGGSDSTLDLAMQDFNVLLAVAMGLYYTGAERFRKTVSNLMTLDKLARDLPTLLPIVESYRRSKVADGIFEELTKGLEDYDELDQARKRRAAERDAVVIDKLIHLNSHLISAHRAKKTDRLHLFMYFSSAPRTERIFGMELVRRAMPKIGTFQQSIWRTREQVFMRLVHRKLDEKGHEDIEGSIRYLTEFHNTLCQIQEMERGFSDADPSECEACVLQNGSNSSCRWLPICEKVHGLMQSIDARRREVNNLSLTLDPRYQLLLQAKQPADRLQLHYYQEFKRIYQNARRDRVLAKMRDLYSLMRAQSECTNIVSRGAGLPKHELTTLEEKRDVVTARMQCFPVKPSILSPKYTAILDRILEYYKTPLARLGEKGDLIDEAYERFLAIDVETSKQTPDHELIRCLLCLSYPHHEGARKAYERAVQLAEVFPERKSEFLYVECWAARKAMNFEEADRAAAEGIALYEDDPRFYHGRCLNTFAWLMHEKALKGKGSHESPLAAAIGDTMKAIGLYERNAEDEFELIAANCNNLVYLYCLDPASPEFDLSKARAAYDKLVKFLPKRLWFPDYSEYFHTEAHLEYEEFLRLRSEGKLDKVRTKLHNAKKNIEEAIKAYQHEEYYRLRDQIENAFGQL